MARTDLKQRKKKAAAMRCIVECGRGDRREPQEKRGR
jgi:hypothetical protein